MGPNPTWANIPFIGVDGLHGDQRAPGNFVFDTGAQVSLMSSELAFQLGNGCQQKRLARG